MSETNVELGMGTLYDLNKQMVAQENVITEEEIEKVKVELEDWFNKAIDSYAMLLCHDRRDYTVFHLYEKQNPNPPALAASELIEVLKERGKIIGIEKTPDQMAWECWVVGEESWSATEEKEAYCYYLFRYDEGIIEV